MTQIYFKRSTFWADYVPTKKADDDDHDDHVYLDKLQTRGVKKSILYM
jgi:hypothetical protein